VLPVPPFPWCTPPLPPPPPPPPQIADGDVPRGVEIPIHMVLPRLFCCPTVSVSRFVLEFEMSVIVTFAEGDGQPGIRCACRCLCLLLVRAHNHSLQRHAELSDQAVPVMRAPVVNC
jgi:hypothetical protein